MPTRPPYSSGLSGGNAKAALILLAAAGAFALMALLIKILGQSLHVTQILFLRQCGMLLVISPQLVSDFRGTMSTGRPFLQLLRAGFALIAMLCGFTAFINMPLADVTAIGFSKSFFVTLFAILILKETVGPRRWIAVFIGFAGVILMVRPGTSSFDFYSLYALAGASAAGLVMVIIRLLSRTESGKTILAYQTILVGLAMAVPAFLYWQTPTWQQWGLLAVLGVVSYLGQRGNIRAYSMGEASLLASLDYVRLIYATILGYVVFSHLPDRYTVFGAVVIIVAAIYTIHREAKLNRKLTSEANARSYTGSQ
ncbi:MAG: DMT family transporter [Pseudomonadota bacterium]